MYTLQVKQNIKIMGSGLMKSEIQNKAEKNRNQRNQKAHEKTVARSDTKRYITQLANVKDLQEVRRWLDNRMSELKD